MEADPNQMRQMVENLLTNAAEAITDRGAITVSTQNIEAGDPSLTRFAELKAVRHVRLAVEDTGCGMEEDTLARAFEPFFSTKGPGRGLGLAAAYGISRNQGGAIHGWSRPGAGSGFEVLLPALEPEPEPPDSTPRAPAATVLLVEEEEAVARLVEAVLADAGYSVVPMREVDEAAAIARDPQAPVDLVLLALSTQRAGARRALQLLRAARPGIKILLCGGGGLDTAVEELLKAGAAGFLAKPYRVDELSRAVRQAMDASA